MTFSCADEANIVVSVLFAQEMWPVQWSRDLPKVRGRSWLCWVELGEASKGWLGLEGVHLSVQSKIIGEP